MVRLSSGFADMRERNTIILVSVLRPIPCPCPLFRGEIGFGAAGHGVDDAAGEKLNEESEVIHVIQVIESRISMTREDRIQRLVETGA